MTVDEIKTWLKDEPGERRVLFAFDGVEVGFEDLALSVEKKPEQQNLFRRGSDE